MITVKKCETRDEINDAKSVRRRVFVDEQKIDQKIENSGDESCDHFVAYDNLVPIGAGRIVYLAKNTTKIERMAVLGNFRGCGIGRRILQTMLDYLKTKKEISMITLDAQYHAKGFYEKFGFAQDGEIFEEVGMPHIKMFRTNKA